ncbi:MAG: class I SAM-dependent methyltransferase [Firmicutes bacterium]|nr:class I SAM-dependent methyltransferase [Bacillota bacterium]
MSEASSRDRQQAKPVDALDSTAVRVALWRALHAEIDPPPLVLEDRIGLQLLAPAPDWRQRRDMNPQATSRARASIVARARFIEDLVAEHGAKGVGQFVLLGAGLDTFAQRHPEVASRLQVFEVDRPGLQAWKRRRLAEEGFATPDWLHFVSVDFEGSWWEALVEAGFDPDRPAVVASAGVVMYLTQEATLSTLARLSGLAAGSTLVMSFMLPLDLVEPGERHFVQISRRGMRAAAGVASFYSPEQIMGLARQAGFSDLGYVSATNLTERYFVGRPDGLRPSSAEGLIVART